MAFIFIAGSDDFLVKRKAGRDWERIAQSVSDPNSLEIIDGQAGNIDEVNKTVTQFTSALQTVSMFAPEKAVWFRNITFLGDSVTGRAKGTQEAVERLLEVLDSFADPAVQVLLSAAPVDRRKKAYKWLHKNGHSTFIEAGKNEDGLVALAEAEAEAAGKAFTGRAALILVELAGGNARLVLGETQKLITYLGPEETAITPELVSQLVPSLGESDFFEAAEAFYSLDLDHTLSAIHRHFFAGHDARPLISSLQNRNRLLIQIKALEAGGALRGRLSKGTLESLAGDYGAYFGNASTKSSFCLFSQNPWYLGRLSEALHRISLRALLDFQEAFREAFLEIIDRPHEQESILSAMAVRCLTPLQQRAG
ncbi:MAG TPA: DNA polymerase III subunit delta [Oceanipulchritudo sp.]|nr:DNA polymerase III subunit delta [Oceanipulchritudo sp.]